MFFYSRSMRSILEVVILLGTLLPVYVVATPIPLPLPIVASDYSPSVNRSFFLPKNRTVVQYTALRRIRTSFPSGDQVHARTVGTFDDLSRHYDAARASAAKINSLAAQATSINSDDYADYQQRFVSAVSDFHDNIGAFQTTFAKVASAQAISARAGKGLDNYDRTNDLEILLKNFINLNKDTMKAIYEAVNALPVLGPILGPIVFNIKCLLDEILDAVEVLSDALINTLQPTLAAIFGKTVTAACTSGVEILGLCI